MRRTGQYSGGGGSGEGQRSRFLEIRPIEIIEIKMLMLKNV